MGNKISSQSNSRIIDNKLAVILEEVNSKLKQSSIDEKEELLISFNNILSKFYKTLTSPILKTDPFRPGVLPNYRLINERLYEAGQDLDIIYREINSLHTFIVENFNTLNSLSASLRARIRKIASDLGDYKLYATDNLGGALYFSDTFKNTDKTDYSDDLYRFDKCFVDIITGCATLPIDESKTKKYQPDSLSIGTISNGVMGNNNELGALRRDKLEAITDDAADTWFEYELISKAPSTTPLVMELKIKLDAASIVNTLDISTVTFGTKKHPKIIHMEVSNDGVNYTSIKEELVSNAAIIPEQGVIDLNPTADNLSDSNRFYFTPRKITYINIVFQQSESYLIRTSSGTAYRKAIGIKDISVIGHAYKAKGELISVAYDADSEIKKIALSNNVTDNTDLTSISNFISPNNGQDWYEIQDVAELSSDAPEILNFNLENVPSNPTEFPVTSIRHKAQFERNPAGFSLRGGTIISQQNISEFLNISPATQTITLKEKPIAGSVSIYNTSYGSVGGSNTYFIPKAEIIERSNKNFVYLPHDPFRKSSIKRDQEIVRIKNEIWKRVANLSLESNTKTYEFDYLNNIIKFGDGTNGLKPDSDIEFSLKRERVLVQNDTSKTINTTYATDKVVSTTSVYRIGKTLNATGVNLRRAGTVHQLGYPEIQTVVVVSDPGSILTSEKDFINGAEELAAAGDYSIDYVNGVLYTYSLAPNAGTTSVDISYREKLLIPGLTYEGSSIVIPNADYVVDKESEIINISSATNVISLSHKGIEPRSIKILSLNNLLKLEVPFKGDGTEFNLPLSPAELQGYYTVDYINGEIYTYSPVVGNLYIDYNYSEYYAEYNMAVEIPREEYSVDASNSTITFSDRYVTRTFSNSLVKVSGRTLFKTSYRYAREIEQNPKELEPFYTPILEDYRLSVLTRERL